MIALDNKDDPKLDQLHYFKGIRTHLKENGFSAFHSNVPWAAGVKVRGTAMNKNILNCLNESCAEKVNIIAHSMGGLDARHMMFDDRNSGRIHEKVASLTTIGTPHHGTSFADWGMKNLGFIVRWGQTLGIEFERR